MGTWRTAVLWWLRRTLGRVVAGLAGIYLLAHGTLFSSSDAVAGTSVAVGAGLVLVATILPLVIRMSAGPLSVETRDQPGQLEQEIEQMREEQADPETVDLPGANWSDGARHSLGERVIAWLLSDLPEDLEGCEARLFLYDSQQQGLSPVYRAKSAVGPEIIWKPGQGAVGVAYASNDFIVVPGDAVSDATYGLDDKMQRRFQALKAVAATPIFNRDGNTIGVLAVHTKSTTTRIATVAGREALLLLAQRVSVCLVDLLRITN